jgi:hypothetical protein
MVYLFHALAVYAVGGRIPTPTRIYVICRGLFILAVALDVVQVHTNKKRSTHYMPLVYHVVNVYTLQTMAAAVSGSLNA